MAVYVDKVRQYDSGPWSHMMADTLEELHTIARRLAVRPAWFQGDHYDIRPSVRELALSMGAIEADSRTLVALRRRLREAQR